jgi:pseudouridine synthase
VKSEKADAGSVRLQKILSAAGVASRRASEQLILEGRITVNGAVVRELGSKADPARDDIRVDGRRIRTDVRHRYILLYKPRGYVTTRSDPEGRPTVLDLMGRHIGYIYPVGRLDYDSEGLLLMTTDGGLAARLTHPRHEVERVYEAIVAGSPDEAAIDTLRRGVYIDGRRTGAAEIRRGQTVKAGGITTKLTITLREGRNRQIRKMCLTVGHPVRSLTRISMGPLSLGHMKPGEWRDLTSSELARLEGAVRLAVQPPAGDRRGARPPARPRREPRDERAPTGMEDGEFGSQEAARKTGKTGWGLDGLPESDATADRGDDGTPGRPDRAKPKAPRPKIKWRKHVSPKGAPSTRRSGGFAPRGEGTSFKPRGGSDTRGGSDWRGKPDTRGGGFKPHGGSGSRSGSGFKPRGGSGQRSGPPRRGPHKPKGR